VPVVAIVSQRSEPRLDRTLDLPLEALLGPSLEPAPTRVRRPSQALAQLLVLLVLIRNKCWLIHNRSHRTHTVLEQRKFGYSTDDDGVGDNVFGIGPRRYRLPSKAVQKRLVNWQYLLIDSFFVPSLLVKRSARAD
jgi:hypothetical protein